jgi:uncharacterized membrane protein HdeD (DUF308 family)
MEYLIIALQIIVGVSILNVWLVRGQKATQWRGGDARSIFEEFEVYGLPRWSVYVIGTLKVILALLLLAGIFYPVLISPAALGLAILLAGSVSMHLKVGDPLIKSFPAALFMAMSLVIAYLTYGG